MLRAWLVRCRDWIVAEAGEILVIGAVAAKLLGGDPTEPRASTHPAHPPHAARAGAHAGAQVRVVGTTAGAPQIASRPRGVRSHSGGTVADAIARTVRVVANCSTRQAPSRAAGAPARRVGERGHLVLVTVRPTPAGAARAGAPVRRSGPAAPAELRVAAELVAAPAPTSHTT